MVKRSLRGSSWELGVTGVTLEDSGLGATPINIGSGALDTVSRVSRGATDGTRLTQQAVPTLALGRDSTCRRGVTDRLGRR